MANERLRQAITNAQLTVEDVASALQVDVKTVRRWLAGRTPYARHRIPLARLLGAEQRDLWPEAEIPDTDAAGRVELVPAFAHTQDAAPDWTSLLQAATDRIWLLAFTLAEILDTRGIPELLAAKVAEDCKVRLLVSYQARARLATDTPIDDDYPDAEPRAAFQIARSRGHIQQLLAAGVQARKFAAMRFSSIIRADQQMLVTLHLWGQPTSQAPALHIRHADQPGLFDQYETHYEAIWENASHPIESEPDLFPPPDLNATHYDQLLFDDRPPDQTP